VKKFDDMSSCSIVNKCEGQTDGWAENENTVPRAATASRGKVIISW